MLQCQSSVKSHLGVKSSESTSLWTRHVTAAQVKKEQLVFTLTADFATAGIHSQCQSTFLTAFYRQSCELGLTLHWMLMIHPLIAVRKSTESAFIDHLR